MRVRDLNWMQVEDYLERDDRIVIPLGCTEQHAYLSLETDNILAERVAAEAAEPLGIPVLPVLPYGLTPSFSAYPGSPTLRLETLASILHDLLDSLADQGFARFAIVNGHGGNVPARAAVADWLRENPEAQAIWHDWWAGKRVLALVETIDPDYGHAGWYENFPWTRLEGVEVPPDPKPAYEPPKRVGAPYAVREALGDGSFGGLYARDDVEMLRIWQTGVEEVRELLESGWEETG